MVPTRALLPDEDAGSLDCVGCLGQERPEQLECVCLDRVEIEPGLDALLASNQR